MRVAAWAQGQVWSRFCGSRCLANRQHASAPRSTQLRLGRVSGTSPRGAVGSSPSPSRPSRLARISRRAHRSLTILGSYSDLTNTLAAPLCAPTASARRPVRAAGRPLLAVLRHRDLAWCNPCALGSFVSRPTGSQGYRHVVLPSPQLARLKPAGSRAVLASPPPSTSTTSTTMPAAVLDIPTWQRPAPTTEKLDTVELARIDLGKWPAQKYELVADLRHAVTDVGFWCVPSPPPHHTLR